MKDKNLECKNCGTEGFLKVCNDCGKEFCIKCGLDEYVSNNVACPRCQSENIKRV